jgi:carboxymethylenebutenolidase
LQQLFNLKEVIMKKLLFVIAILCGYTCSTSLAQSCCMKSATTAFASLGDDKSFVSSHASPLPFTFVPEKGQMITFKTPDGKDGNAFEVKADKETKNYLLVFHEWWGLNDYIKQEAERLQKELGVNVIAVDLYDGSVASNPDEAGKLMQAVKKERAEAIINGAIAHAGTNAKISTIGWCFGGGWSLQAALLAGKQANACVMYYGMPETDKERLKKLNAEVLGIFAGKDQWINAEVVKTFESNMKDAKKKLTVKTFDADHAFANPSNPKYDKVAAEEAHKLAMDFLRKRMK